MRARPFDAQDDFELCNGVFCALAALDDEIDVDRMEEHERVVTLVWHTGGLIGNGGFYYLFSADYHGDPGFERTVAAFQTIGAEAAVQAFRRALACFPSARPLDDLRARKALYAGLPDSTRQEIDRAFWKSKKETQAKLASWIRAHRAQLEDRLRG